MESNARKNFDQNATDIHNLLNVYGGMMVLADGENDPTWKEGMGVLLKSAVVLMVSHWEAYIEDICSEALEHIVKHVSAASKLPKEIKKQVAAELKAAKNELEVWKIADEGWKDYLKSRLSILKEARDWSFNNPKAKNTVEFLKKGLGIEDITVAWKHDGLSPDTISKKLDTLIEVRGQIAHRGRIHQPIDKQWVEDHVSFLRKLVGKTGGEINQHVRKVTGVPLWIINEAEKQPAPRPKPY